MKLGFTRAMVRAALAGKLDKVRMHTDPVFGLAVPSGVPGVPSGVLDPRRTWADPARYDAQAAKMAGMFRDNFAKYADQVSTAVQRAGPTV